jgi:membrane protein
MPTELSGLKPASPNRRWWRAHEVLRESLANFFRENSLMVSASIAYHSLLAIFPLMLLLLGLSGIYIRHHELTTRLAFILGRYLPFKTEFLLRNLEGISHAYGRVGLVSFLLLLWSSSGVFLPLETALNRAWEVEKERSWWRRRLLALEMALNVGFLILASSVLLGANVYFHNWLRHWAAHSALGLVEFVYHLSIIGITFGMTLAMFVLLFERLPNRPMRFRQVFPSALFTALFWEAARSLFALLLPVFNYRQVYGSIGVVVALMTWVYISSAVMLFGAQVSRALYRTLRVAPAAPVVESTGNPP